MSKGKELLFAYYGWLALAVVTAAIWLSLCEIISPEILLGLIGGAISFAHFTQKQKLEETHLFRQLFDGFKNN